MRRRAELAGDEPRVVVDGDVRILPAGAAVVLDAICEDALAEAPEADELLGIEAAASQALTPTG